MKEAILMGLLLGFVHGAVQPASANTTPMFTTGTSNSRTKSTQTVTETFVIVEYTTGQFLYHVWDKHKMWDGKPRPWC